MICTCVQIHYTRLRTHPPTTGCVDTIHSMDKDLADDEVMAAVRGLMSPTGIHSYIVTVMRDVDMPDWVEDGMEI